MNLFDIGFWCFVAAMVIVGSYGLTLPTMTPAAIRATLKQEKK